MVFLGLNKVLDTKSIPAEIKGGLDFCQRNANTRIWQAVFTIIFKYNAA